MGTPGPGRGPRPVAADPTCAIDPEPGILVETAQDFLAEGLAMLDFRGRPPAKPGDGLRDWPHKDGKERHGRAPERNCSRPVGKHFINIFPFYYCKHNT